MREMDKTNLLLSIYIPTYNRASLLKSLLFALGPQIDNVRDQVELIVSDNSSDDNTLEVVTNAKLLWPIKYHRNSENIGGVRNILQCSDLASGQFTWVIGDDDMVRPGAVQHILSVLSSYSTIDYVFVNFTMLPQAKRDKISYANVGTDFPYLLPMSGASLEDRYFPQWDALLDPEIDHSFMGAIQSSVFRTALWRTYPLRILDGVSDYGTSLEIVYPHVVILANVLRGHPAYYIGYPYVIAFEGYQAYDKYRPVIYTVWFPEIVNLFEKLGINPLQIQKYRLYMLKKVIPSGLRRMILLPGTFGREYFSWRKFVKQNCDYCWALIICILSIFSPRPVLRWLINRAKGIVAGIIF